MPVRFLSDDEVAHEIERASRPAFVNSSAERPPLLALSPDDFELLVHALMRAYPGREYDQARLMPAGGDKGRDILLTRGVNPVGIVQCKRSSRFGAPAAIREIVKFLLRAELEPELLGQADRFTYWLALAGPPAKDTVDFFASPQPWLASRRDKIGAWVRTVVQSYAAFQALDLVPALPRVIERLGQLRYRLLDPHELGALLEEVDGVVPRFFRIRPVIDLEAARAMLDDRFAAAGLSASPALEQLSDEECGAIVRAIAADTVEQLSSSGLFKRGRTIERPALEREIRRFKGGAASIWPILGFSGVGKTSSLAWLLEQSLGGQTPVLMVRASEIKLHHHSIVDLLCDLAWPRALGPARLLLDRLARAWRMDPPLILLDGLNEADPGPDFLRNSWIPNSLAWLRATAARLVLTCRPEAWQPLIGAFPNSMLHRPERPIHDHLQEEKEAAVQGQFFRLGDFDADEAAEAAAAYNFGKLLLETHFTHPFMFALAEELDPEEFTEGMEHLAILDTYLRRRVARALGRIGEPSWQPEVLKQLGEAARAMLLERAQVLPSQKWTAHFGRLAPAIDRLAEEHVILASDDGYRFQFDQVREYLQSRSVDLKEVAAEIAPLTPLPRSRLLKALKLEPVVREWVLIQHRLAFDKADRRSAARIVAPSVAAMAIVDAIAARNQRAQPLLSRLFDTTDSSRIDGDAAWATSVIEAVMQFAPPKAVDDPAVFEWIEALLDRYDTFWLNEWPENVVRAIVRYLMRCPGRLDLKYRLLPAILLREHDAAWSLQKISSAAHFEIYWQQGGQGSRYFSGLMTETAAGQFVSHLIDVDAPATLTTLAALVSDRRGIPCISVRGRSQASLSKVASICLYYFSEHDVDLVVAAAVERDGPAKRDLVGALAIRHPNEVTTFCLSRLAAAEAPAPRMNYWTAMWQAAQHSLDGEAAAAALEYVVRGLSTMRGEDVLWALRTFCARFTTYRHWVAGGKAHQSIVDLVDALDWAAERAVILLRAHLQVNSGADFIDEDMLYLLELSFEAGIERIREECESDQGLSATSFAGIRSYLRPYFISEDGRIEQYRELVSLLNLYLDRHGSMAAAQLASFAIGIADKCGSYGSFNGDDVVDLGLLELARRILGFRDDVVLHQASGIVWPRHPLVRVGLLGAVRPSWLSDDALEHLVKTLLSGQRGIEEPVFELVAALRVEGKEVAWDEGARRVMYVRPREPREIDAQILDFWRSLPSDRHSQASREILARVDVGDDSVTAAEKQWRPYQDRWGRVISPMRERESPRKDGMSRSIRSVVRSLLRPRSLWNGDA